MSQTQILNTNQEKPELEIFTWGSCRYGNVVIIYPKTVDLKMFTSHYGEHWIELTDIGVIRYINKDSSKNLHREIEILDVFNTIVVRHFGNSSCSKSFDDIYLIKKVNNELIFEKLEKKIEIVTSENDKYRYTIEKTYVVVDDKKIYVDERIINKEALIEKLSVQIRKGKDKIYVVGDTYHIKDRLKELKFRWDPNIKAWYKENTSIEEVKNEIEKLGVKVGVFD
jgi:hypothetical protein